MEAAKIQIITAIITFCFTVFLTKALIPVLRKKKLGQKILEIGPSWHKNKEGTPTMGGIGFVIATLIAFAVFLILFGKKIDKETLITVVNIYIYGILNCLVGIIDDIAKFKKSQNQGLTPKGKILLQSVFAIVFLVMQRMFVGINTVIKAPILGIDLDLGFVYYFILFLLLCGVTNAVNLTDGLDGLASTCVLSVGAFFSLCGIGILENEGLSFFGGCLTGAALGFLIFNLHPAKVFMGDTGSLFFGGIVVGSSFLFDNPIIAVIYGFVFIFEAITVALQVGFFKLTGGKRIFKMAPFHHHLEKCGFGEIKIVSVFGILSAIFCFIATWSLL